MSKSARLVEWAKRKRAELIAAMGGRCVLCGATEDLQFDHPNGRDWDPPRLSRWSRMTRYRRDWESGNLRLLCAQENAEDGGRRRWAKKSRRAVRS